MTDKNLAPNAVDDTATTPVGTDVIIDVLLNDSDPNGDPIELHGVPTALHGWVEVNPDGTITYHPNPGYEGPDTITYTIRDPDGLTDQAEVAVQVGDEVERDGIVYGTSGDDLIDYDYTGDPDGDLVDHNDELLPGEGPNDDIIIAGAGDDTIYAGEGNDEIDGGTGDDVIYGQDGDDEIIGGDGSDTVYGGDGDDVIDTSGTAPASDYGWPGVTLPDADPFDDRDTVYGGDGDDTISTGDDRDIIFGDAGNDTIDGGLDDDTIDGGRGNDTIIGGHGSDTIEGGAGDDVIWGGMGPGTDPFNVPDDDIPGDVYPIGDPVTDNGMDVISGGAGNDTIYGQDDDDILYGGTGDDYIDGGIDDDYISGGTGSDTLIGGQGNDTLDGGAGNDTMSGGDDRDVFYNVNAGDDVDGGAGGDDYDVLDLVGSAPIGGTLNVTVTGPDSNGNGVDGFVTYYDADGNTTGTLNFEEIEEIVPCFTPGTMVATPKGERPVEELREGDKVITRDNGIQEIRWVGEKAMRWQDFAINQHLKPILVQAGSLGNGLPERDLMVSPNHRLLVANDRTALYFEEREVLVAAKHLIDNKGVHKVDTMGTSYIHFMFDHHEVVLSNGAWTESFQPGDMSLKGIGNAQRTEIFELFPELEKVKGLENYASARRTLKKHEAKILYK